MNISTLVYEEPLQQAGQQCGYVEKTDTQAWTVQAWKSSWQRVLGGPDIPGMENTKKEIAKGYTGYQKLLFKATQESEVDREWE